MKIVRIYFLYIDKNILLMFTNILNRSALYIQSEESRAKAIDRFCWFIVFQGVFYSLLFAFFQFYSIAVLLALISASFRYFVFLNKRSYQGIAKAAIIVTTNLGVLAFSAILGFNSGVYLYFFVSPMLVYLIFDFTQKRAIYFNLLFYLFNFLLVVLIQQYHVFTPIGLNSHVIEGIYNINFVFAFLLCFSLIIYFSNNNHAHIIKLQQSNKDKDVLLSEIHHRVKNNLAVISGLIELQSNYVKDPSAFNILKDSIRRIKTIGLLHEKLYNSENLEKIEFAGYADDLIHYFKNIFPASANSIVFDLDIRSIELPVSEALPLSLILNELITNSLKHAFKENESGKIEIFMKQEDGVITVVVKDNGSGFKINDELKEKSLGRNLVYSLSQQLGEKMDLSSSADGTVFKLEFAPEKQLQ
jgi:two-component sensor histidine kinase